MKPKVLVIGLDCATFKLISPYAEEGYLPNLKRIMENGVTRILKSTIPPVSPPAWATFLTGRNPGKHGIFQFVDMNVKDYGFLSNRIINSSLFSGSTFIDFISSQNLTVGIVKIPFTFPPWKVNGFMIAGEPSPDWKKAHTYPPELSEKLGCVNLGSSTDFILYSPEDLFKHLEFDCNVRTKIAQEMIEKNTYDFFMLVHNITDAAAHRYWKYIDPTCPNYKKKFVKYKNIVRDVYELADKSIGKLLEKIDEDTIIFFMSDHGASRNPIHFFNINAWLKEKGALYYKEKKSATRLIMNALIKIKYILSPKLRSFTSIFIKKFFLKKLSNFQASASNFDWHQTKAYAVTLYATFGGVALNLKGRQACGIVEPGPEAGRLCEDIQSALLEIRDPRNGKKVIEQVYRREDIFTGTYTERLPELIIKFNSDYQSSADPSAPLFSDVNPSDFDFQSGNHDENGIFIAWGKNIRKGAKFAPAQIQDMAPTILYAMGLSVPDEMDGQVLLDIFEQDFVDKNPIGRISESKWTETESYELNEDASDKMKEQLQGLGYM